MITLYKSFVRPHLDYGDIIYDQPNNESFCQKIETVQYNAALSITGAIKGSSREKLYNELGFESLRDRRKLRRLCVLYKIYSTGLPPYLFHLLPAVNSYYNTRIPRTFQNIFCRTDLFKNSFLPYTIDEWNKLDVTIRNSKTLLSFKNFLILKKSVDLKIAGLFAIFLKPHKFYCINSPFRALRYSLFLVSFLFFELTHQLFFSC